MKLSDSIFVLNAMENTLLPFLLFFCRKTKKKKKVENSSLLLTVNTKIPYFVDYTWIFCNACEMKHQHLLGDASSWAQYQINMQNIVG